MDDAWDGDTAYPPLPKGAFFRALADHDVIREQAKRAPQGMWELQRGVAVTWLEVHEDDQWIAPMSVRGVCDKLDLDLDRFYAAALRLAAESSGP